MRHLFLRRSLVLALLVTLALFLNRPALQSAQALTLGPSDQHGRATSAYGDRVISVDGGRAVSAYGERATLLPDLVVQSMRVELETGGSCNYSSTRLGVRVVIANIGTAAAGPFVVEVNGARQTVSAGLAAGRTVSLWFPGFVYSGLNITTVDVTNLVVESNEQNNTRSERLPIPTLPPTCTPTPTATSTPTATRTPTPPPGTNLPDLVVQSMRVELETGGSCNFSSTQLGVRVVIANIGTAAAGPFVVEVNGARQTVSAGLAAGRTVSLWFPGYVFGLNTATVDVTNLVVESNEQNNTRSEQLPIPTLPPTCTPTPTLTPTPTITLP